MKKYFAKYFIENGHFHYVGARIREKATGNIGIIKKVGEGIDETKVEHVKLFLCSRDILVGDRVQKNGHPNKEWEVLKTRTDNKLKVDGLIGWYTLEELQKDCFKVIGPISLDATWVQEGDEFDRDELRIMKTCTSVESKTITEMFGGKWKHDVDEIRTEGVVKIVRVKCKCCNTFK